MRKYYPIWKQLKETGKCAISAHKALHKRIIKAVINEKDRDTGYKILKQSEHKRVILRYSCEYSRVRFFLTEYDLLTGISITDLGETNHELCKTT